MALILETQVFSLLLWSDVRKKTSCVYVPVEISNFLILLAVWIKHV